MKVLKTLVLSLHATGGVILTLILASNNVMANETKAQLAAKAVEICICEKTAPQYLYDEDLVAFCHCESKIWAESGTKHHLRLAMAYITGDTSLMNGAAFNSDDALDFIVKHSDVVSKQCEPEG